VRLYQPGDKRPFLTLTGHGSAVQSIAVAPHGDFIASGDATGEVILWSLACGTCVNRFEASPK
jgi:WD40 repeat protein